MADERLSFACKRTGFILPLLLAAFAVPAHAIRHLTVAQLEKTLTAEAHHHSDAEMVRCFGDFDLTERLTDPTRNRISASLHLGPQTTLALQLLADESALLEPPPGELPTTPPPDPAAARRILDRAAAYVSTTLPHLPDFLSTRTTYTFNDTPQIFKVNEWPVRAGLHLIGNSSREITFRDDKEVLSPATQLPARPPAQLEKTQATGKPSVASLPARPRERGLQSYGEFGTLLGIVFVDMNGNPAHASVTFHHWEQTAAGTVAVFHYSVPRAGSHYSVNYCCLFDGLRTSVRQGRRGGGVNGEQQGAATVLLHKVPAYHGSLFIEPESGVVLRVTLEAEMGDGPVKRAATVIEYGPVTIGDRKFICPQRSMNLYEGPPEPGPPGSALPGTVTASLIPTGTLYLNETSFTDYHRLGSSVRILPEPEAQPQPNN